MTYAASLAEQLGGGICSRASVLFWRACAALVAERHMLTAASSRPSPILMISMLVGEEDGVNLDELDGILQRFDDGRAVQKAKYRGEVFPATSIADLEGTVFLDFFQIDKETGDPKGIVAVDPGGLS